MSRFNCRTDPRYTRFQTMQTSIQKLAGARIRDLEDVPLPEKRKIGGHAPSAAGLKQSWYCPMCKKTVAWGPTWSAQKAAHLKRLHFPERYDHPCVPSYNVEEMVEGEIYTWICPVEGCNKGITVPPTSQKGLAARRRHHQRAHPDVPRKPSKPGHATKLTWPK